MKLRRAQMDDALKALEWRNDETTRQNSFNKELISEESHMNWFKRKLEDDSCLMFILEDNETAVGSVRVDLIDNIGEISYMIAPEARGKGYGTSCLELLGQEEAVKGLSSLVGFVNKGNEASCKCFEKNGYTKLVAGDINCYIKVR